MYHRKAMGVTPREAPPDLRCGGCNRLLARGTVVCVQIKCPRCGTLNAFQSAPRAQSPEPGQRPNPDRP